MIIKMTKGFSLEPIAKRIVATNKDIILILPKISVTKKHPRIIIENDNSNPKPNLIIAMQGQKQYENGDIPVFHFASNEVHTILNDKYLFAEEIKNDPHYVLTIPVTNAQEIKTAANKITNQSQMACIKPRKSVFGHGYWAFGNGDPISMLNDPDKRLISLDQYLFGASKSNIDHIIMPYLPGPEVTFDILAHQGEMLAWCSRTKNNKNENQIISSSHDLKNHVKSLISKFQLNGIVGIQYRQDENGEWKILEINDRPCGGVVKSEAAGARLIEQWAGLMSGRLKPDQVIHHYVKGIIKTETTTVFYS